MKDDGLNPMEGLCPPHDFRAAWASNEIGRLFCRICGDVRALEPPQTEPAAIEQPVRQEKR